MSLPGGRSLVAEGRQGGLLLSILSTVTTRIKDPYLAQLGCPDQSM